MRQVTYSVILVGVALLTSACTNTEELRISDNLRSETQMRISSVEDFSTNFQFSSNPSAGQVEISTGPAARVYSMNEILEGRITQLMRSKFGSIDQSSENSVSVSIESFEAQTENEVMGNEGVHQVDMTVNVEVVRDGETFNRTIERSAEIGFSQTEEAMAPSVEIDEANMNEFISQFVVGVDSFIDSNFGVD
jgi:hypothetical protein